MENEYKLENTRYTGALLLLRVLIEVLVKLQIEILLNNTTEQDEHMVNLGGGNRI